MPAQESQQYEENIYGIPQTFETIDSSLAWFEKQSFDAVVTGDSRFMEMPVVGFCSRFEPGKGAYPFLRAADLNPNVLFAVIGEQYAPVTHPLNVVFLGPQSYTQMPLFYNALDVLCALSVYSYESCPSVVLEGLACGLPIVATQFAGAPELLDDLGFI